MGAFFQYETKLPSAPLAVAGYRFTSGVAVGVLFAIFTALLVAYPLNKRTTIQMSEELTERRKQLAPPNP
jgi:glycoside/pentoside/hexuronide:cation symporter, GPH family